MNHGILFFRQLPQVVRFVDDCRKMKPCRLHASGSDHRLPTGDADEPFRRFLHACAVEQRRQREVLRRLCYKRHNHNSRTARGVSKKITTRPCPLSPNETSLYSLVPSFPPCKVCSSSGPNLVEGAIFGPFYEHPRVYSDVTRNPCVFPRKLCDATRKSQCTVNSCD